MAADWERFAGFGVQFSYPLTTPQGQPAERIEQLVSDHRGEMERVHVHSPDRQELYVEVARFRGITPQEEYANHSPYLVQRFGAVSELTGTTLSGRPAWTYSFGWDEDGRSMERKALLFQVGSDTYRIISDPRSELNEQVIATITIA